MLRTRRVPSAVCPGPRGRTKRSTCLLEETKVVGDLFRLVFFRSELVCPHNIVCIWRGTGDEKPVSGYRQAGRKRKGTWRAQQILPHELAVLSVEHLHNPAGKPRDRVGSRSA